MKIIRLILFSLVFLTTSINAHFDFVTSFDYNTLKLKFPDTTIEDISKIDVVSINDAVKTKLWPTRFPFLAGISNNDRILFYYQFEPFGFSKLIPIDTESLLLIDVAISPFGDIYVLTEKGLSVYHYSFIEKKVSLRKKIPFSNPISCVSNHNKLLGVLSEKGVFLYKTFQGRVDFVPKISEKINQHINNERPVAIAITKDEKMLLITKQHLWLFSKYGNVLKKYTNSQNLNLVDSTIYGDFILASTYNNTIFKYSNNAEYIFNVNLTTHKYPPEDIVVYKPYGNLAIFNKEKASYYTMETHIDILDASQLKKNNHLEIKFRCLITFPSELLISLSDSEKKFEKTLVKQRVDSGMLNFHWKRIDKKFKNGSINLVVKGIYSKSNKIEKSIKLKDEM